MRETTDTAWNDLSDDAHAAAEALGNAGPTIRVQDRALKGACVDEDSVGVGSAYHSADELRVYARGLVEIADWLDRRATLPAEGSDSVAAAQSSSETDHV